MVRYIQGTGRMCEHWACELPIKAQFDNVNIRSSPGSWSAVDAVTPAHEVAAGHLHSIKK